jgi:hypothetical protein
MDGGDRAGYKQIADAVDSKVITSTMSAGSVTGDWTGFDVISSYAAVAAIIAPGLAGSSLISSGRPLLLGAKIRCSKMTGIRLSVKSTGHKVIAHNRILI